MSDEQQTPMDPAERVVRQAELYAMVGELKRWLRDELHRYAETWPDDMIDELHAAAGRILVSRAVEKDQHT